MLFLAFFGPPILRCLVSYELRWEFLLLSGARDCLLFELPAGAKRYRDLVRAVPSACFAYPIPIGSPASAVDVISIETTVVQHRRDQHAVAIDVDVSRGGPIPEEVHPLQAVHFVTTRVQRDLPRCRCRCRSRCCSRCGCRCRCSCWRRCRARARLVYSNIVLSPASVRHGSVRAHPPAELHRLSYSRCRQINLHGSETIGNAAPVRLGTPILHTARVLETGAYACMVVSAGDKAASGQNDVIKRAAVD